jgi:ParB family chromosome partitioning protein
MSEQLIPIDLIMVKDRHRTDLGDLSDLAASIADVGLLQPIGITSTYRLVFGGRRLAACKQLGWAKVPVRFLSNRDDAAAILKAERDENTCRLDMKPSELVALGEALEELERPKARERQAAQDYGRGVHNSSSVEPELAASHPNPTRTAVADAIGMSPSQYQRAKHVVAVAKDEEAPQEVREVAQQAVAEMDAGRASVSGAYGRVRAAETEQRPTGAPDTGSRVRLKVAPSEKIIDRLVTMLAGMRESIRTVDFSDCPATEYQIKEIAESIRALGNLKRTLLEGK